MSSILVDIDEEEVQPSTNSIESEIQDLIERGIDTAKRYGRGLDGVKVLKLKGIVITRFSLI